MNKAYINYNGNLLPAGQAFIETENRCFRYGDGLFESMRWINGEAKFIDLHLQRLQYGMQALGMENINHINAVYLTSKAQELIAANRLGAHGQLRLYVFRQPGGLYTPENNHFSYVLEANRYEEKTYQINPAGLTISLYLDIAKPINLLSNLKTCNALVPVLAGVYKKKNNLDDAILLNQEGFLCEAISANIFLAYQKKLYTPALNQGCVAGIMRQVVIKLANKNNIPVVEGAIRPETLYEADEVFLTNAIKGIEWVMAFHRKRYFSELSKFLIQQLNTL